MAWPSGLVNALFLASQMDSVQLFFLTVNFDTQNEILLSFLWYTTNFTPAPVYASAFDPILHSDNFFDLLNISIVSSISSVQEIPYKNYAPRLSRAIFGLCKSRSQIYKSASAFGVHFFFVWSFQWKTLSPQSVLRPVVVPTPRAPSHTVRQQTQTRRVRPMHDLCDVHVGARFNGCQ